MDEKTLEHLSYHVDEILTSLCTANKIPPLILASIVIARLYHMNEAVNSTEDFKQLMREIGSGKLARDEEQVLH